MRKLGRMRVLALAAALAVPSGAALAQSSATHQVAVTIPTVLRLRLDDGATLDRASVDVAVQVAGGVVRIDPAATRVEVRANAGWALDAHYRPASGGATLALSATLDGATWHRLSGGARLAVGAATGGWRPYTVAYGVPGPVSDGTYLGTVVYTLTQP